MANLFQQIHAILNGVGNTVNNASNSIYQGFSNAGQAISNDYNQAKSSVQNFINTTPLANPTSNNGQNYWSTPSANNLANAQRFTQTALTPQGLNQAFNPFLKISQTAPPNSFLKYGSDYINNRFASPVLNYPKNLTELPQNIAGNHKTAAFKNLMGMLSGSMAVTPAMQVPNAAFSMYDFLKGALMSKTQGGDTKQMALNAMTGQQPVGLGDIISKNPTVRTIGNLAEIPLTIATLAGGSKAFEGLKSSFTDPQALEDTKAYLNELNPEGVLTETSAQTAFRLKAGLKASDVYPSAATDIKTVAKNGLTDYSGTKQLVEQEAKAAAEIANKGISGEAETRLFRNSIEHPENLDSNLSQVKDPVKFQQAVDAYKEFTTSLYNIYRKSSKDAKMGFLDDYYSHIIDTSKEGEAQRLSDYIATKNPQGWFTKERVFKNIDELEAQGFTLKNKSVAQDILNYGKTVARSSSANAFISAIKKTNPEDISVGAKPIGFKQIQSPGLEDTYVSPELYKEIKYGLGSNNLMENPVVATYSKANEIDKSLRLAMGGFHGLKTTIRAVTTTPKSIPGAIWDMLSTDARTNTLKDALDDGTIEAAGKIRVTIGGNSDVVNADSSLLQQVNSKNPITVANQALFGGLIRRFKIDLVRATAKKYDLTDPEQLKQAQAVGEQINNWFGGLNYTVLNRNKDFQTVIKGLGLAPDFNEGKLRTLISALNVTKNDAGAAFARKAIIGEALTTGVISYLAHALADKKFSTDFKSIAMDILQPSIPLPSPFNNPSTGKAQVANLPGNTFTDIKGIFTDPTHFFQARGAALPNLVTQIASNKDYYGQTINQPTDSTAQKVWNFAKTNFPIPVVQGMKALQSKESIPSAILNTAGLRVVNDPNGQLQQQQTQYFKAVADATNKFNDNEMALWNSLHPVKKDINGNTIYTPGNVNSIQKATIYLNNPKMQAAEEYIAKNSGGVHDPIWDLPQAERNVVLASRIQLPGQKNTYDNYLSQQPWYKGFLQQQSFYYNSFVNKPAPTTATTAPAITTPTQMAYPEPSAYVQSQMDAKNWKDPQVQAWFNAKDEYNNQQLVAMGLPPMTSSSYTSKPKKVTALKIAMKKPSFKISIPKTKAPTFKLASLPKLPKTKVKTAKIIASKSAKAKKLKNYVAIKPINWNQSSKSLNSLLRA
jgi:hypothetical protein